MSGCDEYNKFFDFVFLIHRTVEDGGGYLINSSLILLFASQLAESSPLHIARGRNQTGNLWFPISR